MLKKLVSILSAGLMIAALMSCAQEKKEEGPITLHYWTHEDPARTELETKLIANLKRITRISKSSGRRRALQS